MKARNKNGLVLFETPWIVAIVTGFKASKNRKTGSMLQVWFIPKWIHPKEAAVSGKASLVCGDCPLQPSKAQPGDPECYVRPEQAPAAIWHAYKRGSYDKVSSFDVFNGRTVRFGAWGDPTKLPLAMVADIAGRASKWTGYTHQWRNPLFQGYRDYLMASADDVECQIEASKLGWRTFRVAPAKGELFRMRDEILCPASKEAGHKTQCERCGLCNGAQLRTKNIVIVSHRNKGKRAGRAVNN